MAYTAQHTARATGFAASITALMAGVQARVARRRIYRETLRELEVLSNRELADLGLSRSAIKRVAVEAVRDL